MTDAKQSPRVEGAVTTFSASPVAIAAEDIHAGDEVVIELVVDASIRTGNQARIIARKVQPERLPCERCGADMKLEEDDCPQCGFGGQS